MSSRKLQTEIDKVLKKVAEGVETFEEIFDKIQTTTNANQKEKYESDLKKEIKKLQRQRDQIKTWISSNEIKDKRALTDNRKLIEQQMEKFKACEKEMKTKAYSKEGLSMSARMDPKEKEKAEMCSWVTERVEALNIQIEGMEAEVETLQSGVKKSKKDPSRERMAELEEKIERHKWHQLRLELILRLLENGQIEIDKVAGIQEDVNYYVDENTDPDFAEDEEIYADLNLEEEEEYYAVGADDHHANDDNESRSSKDHHDTPDHTPKRAVKEPEPEPEPARPAPKTTPVKKTSGLESKDAKAPGSSSSSSTTASATTTATATTPAASTTTTPPAVPAVASTISTPAAPTATKSPANARGATATAAAAVSVSAVAAKASVVESPVIQYATAAAANLPADSPKSSHSSVATPVVEKSQVQPTAKVEASPASTEPATKASTPTAAPTSAEAKPATKENSASSKQDASVTAPSSTTSSSVADKNPSVPPSERSETSQQGTPTLQAQASQQQLQQQQMAAQQVQLQQAQLQQAQMQQQLIQQQQQQQAAAAAQQQQAAAAEQEIRLPAALADLAHSFEASKDRAMSKDAGFFVNQMLEASYQYIPEHVDTERPKFYQPNTTYPTPSYYPQTPPPGLFESAATFEKFDIDTLFFIFYYQQGTYQQYLAARELKKQSWRFHKKYVTWFQRHEEPKAITDDYEQGTYIYFDYEGAWCQRKKTEFRFEYKFLEDAELV